MMVYSLVLIPIFSNGMEILNRFSGTQFFVHPFKIGGCDYSHAHLLVTHPDCQYARLGSIFMVCRVPCLVVGRRSHNSTNYRWWKIFKKFNLVY